MGGGATDAKSTEESEYGVKLKVLKEDAPV